MHIALLPPSSLAGDTWQELTLAMADGQPADVSAAFRHWEQHAPTPRTEQDDDTATEPDQQPSNIPPAADEEDDPVMVVDASVPRCNFQDWLEGLGFTAAPLLVPMRRNQLLRHVHMWRQDQDRD